MSAFTSAVVRMPPQCGMLTIGARPMTLPDRMTFAILAGVLNSFRKSAPDSGGMVLSGDDLTKLPPARAAMLKKLLPPTGVAAAFPDDTLRIGTVTLPNARMWCGFE